MKNKGILVSVIMPVYNGENFIKESLYSLVNQTYKNIEIIIVDDGSIDATKKIIQSVKDKRIKYIYQDNGGCAKALNNGIKNMTGEYFCWLSHDDLYEEDKIETQVQIIQKLENKKTLLFSNVKYINDKGKLIYSTDFEEKLKKCENEISLLPVLLGAVNGCTIFINKKCIEETQMFDENKKTTHDYDMWYRLFKKYPHYFIPKHLIKYRIHPNQDTNKHVEYIKECDELWMKIVKSINKSNYNKYDDNDFNLLFDLKKRFKSDGFINSLKKVNKKIRIYNHIKEKFNLKNYLITVLFEKFNPAKVSVIIPCYNREKFLNSCLISIFNAIPSNTEVIIINDGSTDNTREIIKRYKLLHKNIKFYDIEHKGIGYCRNLGISVAKGKYILFVDSDDEINENYFRDSYLYMLKNYDMIICDFQSIEENGYAFNTTAKDKEFKNFTDKEGIEYTSIMPSLCNKIIKRKIIKKTKYQFPEDIKYEDLTTTLFYILNSDKIKYINKANYIYNIHSNSIMRNNNNDDMFKALNMLFIRLQAIKKTINNYDQIIFYTFFWRIEEEILNKVNYNIETNLKKIYWFILPIIQEMKKSAIYKKYLKNFSKKDKEYLIKRNESICNKTLQNFIEKEGVKKFERKMFY